MKEFFRIIFYGYKDYGESYAFAVFWGIAVVVIMLSIIGLLMKINS